MDVATAGMLCIFAMRMCVVNVIFHIYMQLADVPYFLPELMFISSNILNGHPLSFMLLLILLFKFWFVAAAMTRLNAVFSSWEKAASIQH